GRDRGPGRVQQPESAHRVACRRSLKEVGERQAECRQYLLRGTACVTVEQHAAVQADTYRQRGVAILVGRAAGFVPATRLSRGVPECTQNAPECRARIHYAILRRRFRNASRKNCHALTWSSVRTVSPTN